MNSTPQSTQVRVRSVYVTGCLPSACDAMARPSEGCPRRAGEAGGDSGGPHDPGADDKDPVAGAPVNVRPQDTTLARVRPCGSKRGDPTFTGRSRADQPVTMRADARVGRARPLG